MSEILWPRLNRLLDCAADELDRLPEVDPALDGAPERRYVAPGAVVAWDNCCDGQLVVRVARAWPANPFPTKVLAQVPCSYPIAVQIGLSIVRCVAVLDDRGRAPSADETHADGHQMVSDMGALLRAIECCLDEDAGDTVIDQWAPLGPNGGCAGGEWLIWWAPSLVAAPFEEEGSQ